MTRRATQRARPGFLGTRTLALFTAALASACVSDLSVGLSALETADASEPSSERDASTPRDAQTPKDAGASCSAARCDDPEPDAGEPDRERDASDDRDASDERDERDASDERDAELDAGNQAECSLSECQAVGFVRTLDACRDGKPEECLRGRDGVCEYMCPEAHEPLSSDAGDASRPAREERERDSSARASELSSDATTP